MNTSQATIPPGNRPSPNGDIRPGFRTKTIATRLTPEELVEVESAAERAGKPLAEWLRETALAASRSQPFDAAELLLAEIWAVRYALLNLFRAAAQANAEGKVLPPEFVAKIRSEADIRKFVQARKLIDDHAHLPDRDKEM